MGRPQMDKFSIKAHKKETDRKKTNPQKSIKQLMLTKKVSDEKDETRWAITTHLSQTKMLSVTVMPY